MKSKFTEKVSLWIYVNVVVWIASTLRYLAWYEIKMTAQEFYPWT